MHRKRSLLRSTSSYFYTGTSTCNRNIRLIGNKRHAYEVAGAQRASLSTVKSAQERRYQTSTASILSSRRSTNGPANNSPSSYSSTSNFNSSNHNASTSNHNSGNTRFSIGKGPHPSEDAFTGDFKDRTVVLTPWRGSPTFLHAVAFVRELEKRYGKIKWCGLYKDDSNPYEYKPSIMVIFESPASLRKMPGFSAEPIVTGPSGRISSSSGAFDLGPSTALDPTSHPNSQAMLKSIASEASKINAQKGRGEMDGAGISPLFMPWSEKLDEAALRKGGPALEDVLLFFGEEGKEKGSADGGAKQATWDEFDEALNIDAVIRKWEMNRLYLPRAAAPHRPYFKPTSRLSIARLFVDFAGFAPNPAPSMERVVEKWKAEVDESKAGKWTPWDEQSIAEGVDTRPEEFEETAGDYDWNAVEADEWLNEQYGLSNALPSQSRQMSKFERIQREAEDAGDDSYYEPTTTFSEDGPVEPTSINPAAPSTSESKEWDSWRTDPRPFSSAVGAGADATAPPQRNLDGSRPPTYARVQPKGWQYSALAQAQRKGIRAAQAGYEEENLPPQTIGRRHSPPSAGFGKDMRGTKMRVRESRQGLDLPTKLDLSSEEDGPSASRVGRNAVGRGRETNGRVEELSWDEASLQGEEARYRAKKMEEKKLKEERDLKARLRAILDGTSV